MRLTCAAGRTVGIYCLKCGVWFIQALNIRLNCDATETARDSAVSGACPVCDNGQSTEAFVYYEGAVLTEEDEEDEEE